MSRFTNSFSEETWYQKYKYGTDENVEHTWKRVADDLASVEEDKEKWSKEFYHLLEDFKFVPGGRITSNAGTGLRGTTYINCFHGDTEVITRDGIFKIKDLVCKDLVLLGKHGKWVTGSVKNFGKQELFKLTLKHGKKEKIIFTTANHKWFAYTKANKKSVELLTCELKDYHRLEQSVSKSHHSTSPSPVGVAQGFTYGDGSTTPKNCSGNTNLCGDKDKCLVPYFYGCNKLDYGSLQRYTGIPNSWRNLPDLSENISFLLGWLSGYFAADGCVSEEGECVISSSKSSDIGFVKSVCSILGIRYFSVKKQTRVSNLTGKESDIYSLCLDSKDLNEDFFVIEDHKNRFLENQRSRVYHWNVVSVEPTGLVEDVYCAMVPDGNKFTLEGNILTSNCFVDGFQGEDLDSIEGIYEALLRQAKILKSEGGYGFCSDVMRPCGSHIAGIANQSPGAVRFLELWDKSSEIITAGSNKKSRKDEKNFIRKGAQMVTMSCWHPDIIEYISAKKTPGRLSKFNMSVLCTEKFMNAVENDEPWELVFPNHEDYPETYKECWDGNIEKWKENCEFNGESKEPSIKVYHKFNSARELWDLIMENTYNRNEPGVLFVDNMNKMNNLWYNEWINATNPCGEQVLPIGGVCLLGSINLVHYIDPAKKTWLWDKLEKDIHLAVRFMDNVNDKTYVPLKSQEKNLKDKRRIGLGVMGYGSALLMARVKYGSKKALAMTDQLMAFFTNTAYEASALIAKEKGSFNLYDEGKYLKGEFIKGLDGNTIDLIKKYGIRNSHLTSIQPTGNGACYANLVSGGLEPLFMFGYYRTSIQPIAPDGMWVPVDVDWSDKKFNLKEPEGNKGASPTEWKWVKEGDEHLLATKFNGKTWKYDRSRGLLKEEWLEDYGVSYLKGKGLWDENGDYASCTMDLGVDAHVDTMSIFARYVDSAISKTINLINEYPYEEFKDVYIKAWKNNIKGFTTYRAGTMTSVLSSESSLNDEDEDKITKTKCPERPKKLHCDVHHMKVKGEEYFVLVGMYNDDPYEVFAGKNGFIDKKITSGKVIKLGRPKGVYKAILEDGLELSPINATCSTEEDALTRMTSTALRHGADIHMIVQQLEKVKGDMHSFAKSMARALKKYIPDGAKEEGGCPSCEKVDSLMRQEGCVQCSACGWSKCM